jgi:hypothetical protein
VIITAVLGAMSVLDNELDIAAGGADETRAITALDMAQDMFEAVLATHPDTLGTSANTATVANTEATTWPTGLLRIDTMWYLNTATTPNLPAWEIDVIQDVGGHAANLRWPFNGGFSTGRGAPVGCYTNRANLYWQPLPDAVYTVRINGLFAKTAITTQTQTFEYPDEVRNPIAAFANRLLSLGVADPTDDIERIAAAMFGPVIKMLRHPTRQRPQSRQYSRMQTT